MEAQTIAQSNNIALTDKERLAIKALADQAQANAVNLAAVQMGQDLLTPWEKYEKKLRDIVQIQSSDFPLSAEKAAKATAMAASSMEEVTGKRFQVRSASFQNCSPRYRKETMLGLSPAKQQRSRKLSLILTSARQRRWPNCRHRFGEIAAAGVIAAGLASVAKIIAQKPKTTRQWAALSWCRAVVQASIQSLCA